MNQAKYIGMDVHQATISEFVSEENYGKSKNRLPNLTTKKSGKSPGKF